MNHPDYKRTYWTPERRQRASEQAKARWAERRAWEREQSLKQRERAERVNETIIGQVRARLKAERANMDRLAREWHRAKAAAEAMEKAEALLVEAHGITEIYGVKFNEQLG